MRTTRALAASAAAVAALGLAAPVAVARDGMNLTPSNVVALPSVIARGGQLTITVNNCTGPATASSDAFRTITLTTGPGNLATGTAELHVRNDPEYDYNNFADSDQADWNYDQSPAHPHGFFNANVSFDIVPSAT